MGLPCKTTDRNTGITTERGLLQRLEKEYVEMRDAYFHLEEHVIAYVNYTNGLRADSEALVTVCFNLCHLI